MANQKGKKKINSSSRKKKIEKDEGLQPYRDEIAIIITLVVCILLILSNMDMCGKAGVLVSHVLFGLFGCMNYLLPFGIFIGMAFYVSNKGNRKAKRKLISVAGIMVDLTALLQMITGENSNSMSLSEFYQDSSASRLGGGVIGGVISHILSKFFGEIGAAVILVGIGILLFMFITEKLLFAYLGRQSYKKMQVIKEEKTKRRQNKDLEESRPAKETKETKERKAVFFTLEKEQKNTETGEALGKNTKKKRKKENNNGEQNKDAPAGMKEILPKEISEFTVEGQTEGMTDSIPVYEEEFMDRFNPVHAKCDDSVFQVEKESAAESVMEEKVKLEKEEVHVKTPNKVPPLNRKQETVQKKSDTETDKPEPPAAENQKNSCETVKLEKKKELENSIKPGDKEEKAYEFPPVGLLQSPDKKNGGTSEKELKETAYKLHSTLESFGVKASITNVSCGPAVTRYELHPEQGVKVSRITNLADDIKLNLAAADIRIEAPIPGKAAVGIEVPNKENSAVMFRELIESQEFRRHSSKIAFAVGKDIGGKAVVADISRMPHLLIAGATGSGKSVCINSLIMSILYKAAPDEVKLIMIDPKVVELSVYNGIPHLLIPVVTEPKKASAALNWAVTEMTDRYNKFAELGVRDIKGYNVKVKKTEFLQDDKYQKMPQIIIIVDELADLMMAAPGEVEEAICRLAQLARAAGIHLIIATQRPSVNVITGVIKANIPSRIAFSVSSAVDSRTIIDGAGAEKLLGKGDMLFYPTGYPKPIRVQGAFVTDQEVSQVVEFLTRDIKDIYDHEVVEKITTATQSDTGIKGKDDSRDEYFLEAAKFIIEKDKASIGMLQRVFKIGFNRASRIMDQLYDAGVVGEDEGTKPRKVIMSKEQFDEFQNSSS